MVKSFRRLTEHASLFAAVFAAWVAFYPVSPAQAANAEESALIEGAKLCTRYLPRHERQYGIPEHLLAAIASSESGRFHRGLGLNLPWPWTINVNGRGYFFDTKEEAIAAVNKFRSAGYNSIDIGCMQVNLRHHPTAFTSVEQAFDPAYNVGYAASFLKRNFQEEGSWRKATAAYHSKTDSYGSPYATRVFGAWGRIVSKVADARAGRPVLNATPNATQLAKATTPSRLVRPSYRSLQLRSISVTSNDKRSLSREKGVLVVRPKRDAGSDDIIVHSAPAVPEATASKAVKVVAMKPSEVAAMDAMAKPQAAKPDTVANAPDAPNSGAISKPVKVVSLSGNNTSAVKSAASSSTASSSTTKGQFTPKTRSSASAALDKAAAQPANKNMFVFDY